MTNEELYIQLLEYRKQVDDKYERGPIQEILVTLMPPEKYRKWVDAHLFLFSLDADLDDADFGEDADLEEWYVRRIA